MDLFYLAISSTFVNNILLAQYLGILDVIKYIGHNLAIDERAPQCLESTLAYVNAPHTT